MALVAGFRAELPLLRRCGRGLTGDQTIADTCVLKLMDELRSGLHSRTDTRILLYSRYLELLRSRQFLDTDVPICPIPWQAHWLVAVEGFEKDAAAQILGLSDEALSAALAAYMSESRAQPRVLVMIIEDEPLIAHDLKNLIRRMGHKVTGIARTAADALDSFSRCRPDLILSDVLLADGSTGIEAVEELNDRSPTTTIFVTAFPEQLLTGEKEEPTFLVSKPFDPRKVEATIRQAVFLGVG